MDAVSKRGITLDSDRVRLEEALAVAEAARARALEEAKALQQRAAQKMAKVKSG